MLRAYHLYYLKEYVISKHIDTNLVENMLFFSEIIFLVVNQIHFFDPLLWRVYSVFPATAY